jgi:signal transduction histidine kinase/DNA-binding NarL/FixJ family response regulator
MLLTSAVHIFILAFQEGGVASISVVWMLALSVPLLLGFGLRGSLISMALSILAAGVLAWLDAHNYTPALPPPDQNALASAIKFTLVVMTVLSFPIITVITQSWVIRMSARRVALIDSALAATKQAQLRQQRFVSSVSHELRTPMNAIMGFIQSPPQALLSKPENQALFGAMRNASKHLMTVIDDLMDFSRLQTGELKITPIETRLGELTREISQIFSNQLAERGVAFQLKVDPRIPDVALVDTNRYAQILINLLSNAAKFTTEGEVGLTVAVRPAPETIQKLDRVWIRVTVSDTGIGIEPGQLDQLFEAFTPSNNRTNNAFGGAGLGLCISKKLVELMGGEISVSSQPDRGTGVSFDIPVQAVVTPASPPETELQDAFTPPQLENVRVLIVDDSVVNRMVISQLLRSRLPDVTIREVNDGLEAVNAVTGTETNFDLILMDILMPNLNGIEATLQIKALGRTTPIIGLTADVSEAVARDAAAAGMFALLTKPFSHSELLTTMADAIKQPAVESIRPSATDGAALAQSTSEQLTESFSRRWEKRIQAFAESSSHSLFGLVFWTGTFVCALYAVMAPDARMQLIYVGMTVISVLLALVHRLSEEGSARANFLIWIYFFSTTAATAGLVACSGGLNSIASAYFLCVSLVMLTQRIPGSGYALGISIGVALVMGMLQSMGLLHTPTAAELANNPWWSFILFVGLALCFLIIPVLRLSYYRKLVTTLWQKRTQLVESRRSTAAVIQSQNDFVAAVSHELRNPIHAISLVVNAFDEEVLDSQTSHLTLQYVSRSVSDLLRTIDNLLIFSQIQAQKLNLNYELIDLNQWVLSAKRDITDLTRGLSDQEAEIELHYEIDDQLPAFLYTDPVRLCHVIRELISNAAKFSARKPISVAMCRNVTATDDAPTWSITITDQGVGIKPSDKADMYNRFWTVDNCDRPSQRGNGLGLPITKALVDLMGGTLTIDSVATGGTQATVTLPLQRDSAVGEAPYTGSNILTSYNGVIAIVDDSDINLLVLQHLLKRNFKAATIVTASTWAALVKLLDHHHPAVVLMDVFMPKVDGRQATRLLRQHVAARGDGQPSVIGVTADRRYETRRACLDAGMNTVVLKPFNHRDLVQIIVNECAKQRAALATSREQASDASLR